MPATGQGQFAVLLELWAGDGLTQKELVERLDVEQATMANTLARMVRDGLVERRGENLADRLDRLHEVVSDLDSALDAERALSEICNEMLTDDSEDDVAILVARVAGHP